MFGDDRDAFAGNLEAALQVAGMTNADLARAIGAEVSLVDSWLDGDAFPCPRRFGQVQATLSVTRDELLAP